MIAGAVAWPLLSSLLMASASSLAQAAEASTGASATRARLYIRCDVSRESCQDERGRWVVRRQGPLLQVRARQGRIHSFRDHSNPGSEDHLDHAFTGWVPQVNAVHIRTAMHEGFRGDLINLDTGAKVEASGGVLSPDGRTMAALACDEMGCRVDVRPFDWRAAAGSAAEARQHARAWSCTVPSLSLEAPVWEGNGRVVVARRADPRIDHVVRRLRSGSWASNLPCETGP